ERPGDERVNDKRVEPRRDDGKAPFRGGQVAFDERHESPTDYPRSQAPPGNAMSWRLRLPCSIRGRASKTVRSQGRVWEREGGGLRQVHAVEEILVTLRLRHARREEFHRLDGVHVTEDLVQHVDLLEFILGAQEFLLAGARGVDIDGGPDALVHEAPVEAHFHVAGALELLEDHVVHAAAGVDERGSEDGQRAALLDVAGGAEEALRLVQG